MKIQAKLSFSHDLIKRILKENKLTAKKLAKMCGWHYQNINCFINFRTYHPKENMNKLFKTLLKLDPTIQISDVFFKNHKEVIKILKPRVSIKEIPENKFVPLIDNDHLMERGKENYLHTDNNFDDKILFNCTMDKFLNKIKKSIGERKYYLLASNYGLKGFEKKNLRELAKEFNLTHERIRQIIERIMSKIIHNGILIRPYEELNA